MKKTNGILKFILIVTLVMGILTVVLLFLQTERAKNDQSINIDPETIKLVQLEAPKEGDPIAIVDTTLGEFRFVLYPQYSPLAVKNFTDLAESGYYDGTYVFNSESGVYSAAGCPKKNGTMPEDTDASHERIPRELSQDLWPLKGAVCMMNTELKRTFKEKLTGGGKYYNGSRFAMLNTIEFDDELKNELINNSQVKELADAFIEKGGIPNFSQQMTIIGQTYEGIEVIEALSELETENNGVYKLPVKDIMINSVKIDSYTSEKQS